MPCSAVLRLEEEIELFEADLEAMGCGEGRAKVCGLRAGHLHGFQVLELNCHRCGGSHDTHYQGTA